MGETVEQPVDLSPSTLTRARIYVLLESLESDLRALLGEWVAPYKAIEDILGARLPIIRQRAGGGHFDADTLLSYVDFHDSFSLLNRHSAMLPGDTAVTVREFTPRLDALVAVRNRVMHGRPLEPDDPSQAARLCADLVDSPMPLPGLHLAYRRVAADPSWTPAIDETAYGRGEHVLHNLPLPDFDETGLIGRRSENAQLLTMLLKRRIPVVTLVGEGGIGKTALAVKVLYDLVDHADCPYDAVLWTSLKREQLTAAGVEVIRDAVSDLTGITGSISGALDPDFEGTVEDLGQALEGLSVLIVIDNLESTTADEVLTLYDAMPEDVRFLFTSRVGLGQLERRVPVGPLSPRDGEFFFRKLAERRSLEHLVRQSSDVLARYLRELRYSPLAIRWFVEAIDSGADPDWLIRNQQGLLEFCMAAIHDNLDEPARQLLGVLYALDGAVGVNGLAVLSDLAVDDLRRAAHDLQRRSLAEVQPGSAGSLQLYGLTAATRDYMRTVAPPDPEATRAVLAKLAELRAAEEQRRKDDRFPGPNPNAVAVTSDADRPVAYLLRTALRDAKRGGLDRARATLVHARELAPEYFEVHRVLAFIESSHQPTVADAAYRDALALAPPEHRPKVAYFYAGHLGNVMRDASAALVFAREAHSSLGLPETALRLARTHMYLEEFSEARALLEAVLANSPTERTKVIAQTDLANLTKRQVEVLGGRDRKPLDALVLGVARCRELLTESQHGRADRRLVSEVFALVSETLRVATSIDDLTEVEEFVVELLQTVAVRRIDLATFRDRSWMERWLEQIAERRDCPDACRAACLDVIAVLRSGFVAPAGATSGVIHGYSHRRGYGFVELEGSVQRAYFSREAVPSLAEALLLRPGATVACVLEASDRGPIAVRVRAVCEPERLDTQLRGMRGIVTSRQSSYLFIDEEHVQVPVFCHRSGFAAPADWQQALEGVIVEFDAVVEDERLRVPDASAHVVRTVPEAVEISALLRTADALVGESLNARVNVLASCRRTYARLAGVPEDVADQRLRERIVAGGRLVPGPGARGPARSAKYPPIAHLLIDDLTVVLVDGTAGTGIVPQFAEAPLAAITVYR